MYERSYGYRYNEVEGYASPVEIAKLIRRDVKQAVDEGLLPAKWSYSVTSDSLAVQVEVRDCADAFRTCDGGIGCHNVWCVARNDPKYAHAAQAHEVLTDEAEVAKMTLKRIHDAYNHDGSEIQVDYHDVRYYGMVSFEDPSTSQWRAAEKAKMAAKKAAREGGTVAGKVVNHGRDGKRTVHLLIENTEGKKVLACGARIWRGSLLSKASDHDEVNCSRCQKREARG